MRRSDKKRIRDHEKKIQWAKTEMKKVLEDERRKFFPLASTTKKYIHTLDWPSKTPIFFSKSNRVLILDLCANTHVTFGYIDNWVHVCMLTVRGFVDWSVNVHDAKDFWIRFDSTFEPIRE